MKYIYTLAVLLLCQSGSNAQNWIVGQAVDANLSSLIVYGGGCYPGIQALLNYSGPSVDGVALYYKVVSIETDGEYTMNPGTGSALIIGDLVPLTAVGHQVYNTGTYGGLGLEVHAIGTPTTPGQTHPCAPNDLWMSNLLLCQEGLSNSASGGCVTEQSTGIAIAEEDRFAFMLPSVANGFRLQLADPALLAATVSDMHGRAVATIAGGQRSAELNSLAPGAYVVDAIRTNGHRVQRRFVLAGQ